MWLDPGAQIVKTTRPSVSLHLPTYCSSEALFFARHTCCSKASITSKSVQQEKKMKELLYKSQDLHGVEKLGLHAPSLPAPVEPGLHVPTGGSGWGLPTWSGSGVFWQQVIWQGGWKSEVLSEDRGWGCQWTAYSQCSLHLWSHWLFSSGLCNPFLLR